MMFVRVVQALFSVTTIAAAQVCHSATLDFEDIECAKTAELCGAGDIYVSKGFTLTYAPAFGEMYPTGFQAVGKLWQFNRKGSTAMNTNSCSATATLVANDNNPFTIYSIDLAELNGDGPGTAVLTGNRSDNTQVIVTFKLNRRTGWQRFSLPFRFQNLTSLVLTQGDCVNNMPYMYDNIIVKPSWTLKW